MIDALRERNRQMEAFSRLPIPARGEKNQTKSRLYVTLLHFEKASHFNVF